MEIKTMLTKVNYTPMNNKKNLYIVIHYVGAVSSAYNNAKYFRDIRRGASAHYFVDEKDIYQVVREKDASWHCGASTYRHPKCRNSNSIGIEMCCFKNNGKLDVSETVVKRTAELTKELMAKYDIPVENVIRHYDVTGKNCPAPMVESPSRWNQFKALISKGEGIKYQVHIEAIGWQESKENGEIAGTTGEALRIEAMKIETDEYVEYRGHVQDIGWTDWVKAGEIIGTTGQAKRLEAIEIKSLRTIRATAHVQDIGWQDTVVGKNIRIGTEGRALRLEALTLEFV